MKWLVFAFRNLFRNKRRTLVTVVVAATGTASIVCSIGFALFTYAALKDFAANDTGHLIVAHQKYFTQEEETPLGLAMEMKNLFKLQKHFENNPKVRSVLPKITFSGLISNGEKTVIFSGNGIEAKEQIIKRGVLKLHEGGWLSRLPKIENLPEVLLAVDLASRLNTKVGEVLTLLSTTSDGVLNAIDVQVKGIVSLGVPELDKRMLWAHLFTSQELLMNQKVSSAAIYLYNTEDTDIIKKEVEDNFSQNAVHTWLDEAFFYKKVRSLYDRIFNTLGIILIIITFLAVFNTLSMTVVERTREIGTLAAIGTHKNEILRIFILEATLIGLFSSMIGVIVSWITSIVVLFLEIPMPPPPGRSDSYPFIIDFSLEISIYTIIAITTASIIAAWLAARRGVKKTIVEALTDV